MNEPAAPPSAHAARVAQLAEHAPAPPTSRGAPDPASAPGHELSPLLAVHGFRHAFFSRCGGASLGPYASLSFSTAVGDEPAHVEENLRRAGSLLRVAPERLLYLSQVHGRRAHFLAGARSRESTITLEGDAVGGREPDTGYGVRTADCVPILLADATSGAVMAVHAGWRGVVAGVVESGVRCLRAHAGSRGRLLAAIGPHISAHAFEVSEDVAHELAAVSPTPDAVDRSRTKPHVSLRKIVRELLIRLGLAEHDIDDVGGCTYGAPERYFSFRRDGKLSGRHLSVIVPRL